VNKDIVHVINSSATGAGDIDITIRLSNKCNQSCTYCNEYNNSEIYPTYDYMISLFDSTLSQINDKNIRIYIFGGEPTIIPKFYEVVVYVINNYKNVEFEIQTNTTKNIEWFSKFSEYSEYINFNCSFQYHQYRQIDNLYAVIPYLKDNNLISHLDIMLEDGHSIEINKVIEKLKTLVPAEIIKLNFVDFTYNPEYEAIVGSNDNDKKDDEFAVTFKNGLVKKYSENDLRKSENDNFMMFRCRAGNRTLIIETNGDIFYCKSRRLKDKCVGNVFGENKIKSIVENEWILCSYGRCFCEMHLEKKRVGWNG
jgi:MoaA/NifB/PqqE/SkfB family radical SAM enzyme